MGEFDINVPLTIPAGYYDDDVLPEALTEVSGTPRFARAALNLMVQSGNEEERDNG